MALQVGSNLPACPELLMTCVTNKQEKALCRPLAYVNLRADLP